MNNSTGKEFILSKGQKVIIREAKGKDAEAAMRIAGQGQQEKYLSALMARTITIDGKAIVPEALAEFPLKDYLKIQGEFADLNF